MTAPTAIIIYLVAINIITFFAYGADKRKAQKKAWRTPEAVLILLAIVGGSLGAWIGMQTWHHKTQHVKFKYGVPIILLIQVAALLYFFFNSPLF